VAGDAPEAVTSTWSDDSDCWADVYDDDHEMQARQAKPEPGIDARESGSSMTQGRSDSSQELKGSPSDPWRPCSGSDNLPINPLPPPAERSPSTCLFNLGSDWALVIVPSAADLTPSHAKQQKDQAHHGHNNSH
jgi:hypothetical protein